MGSGAVIEAAENPPPARRRFADGGVAPRGKALRATQVPSFGPKGEFMTLLWFVVWLVANVWGDHEPLQFDPVNWWAGTLILAAALDLGRQHVPRGKT
jgi:hypothetical protein